MNAERVSEAMEAIAPRRYAEPWDNVGLLVGAGDWPARKILLTIDLTRRVMAEAIEHTTQMIVTYHPLLFKPVARFTDETPVQRTALDAARRGVAVYSPHTAFDAAPAGVNDWLALALDSGDVRAIEPGSDLPETQQCKLVTFCPADATEAIRNALASVGAGRIGSYERCSFESTGTGTFVGGPDAHPAVGERGRLERVDEVRLEMVCPRASLPLAVLSLREFHPYEEPPIEIHELQPRPMRSTGAGRRVRLDRPVALSTLANQVKKHLGVRQLRVAAGDGGPRRHATIGLCAGAGGSLLDAAIAQGCTVFVTGEMRHHDVLSAQARGCCVMLAGHTNTERGYLKVLKPRLAAALEGVEIRIARADGDPLRVV